MRDAETKTMTPKDPTCVGCGETYPDDGNYNGYYCPSCHQ